LPIRKFSLALLPITLFAQAETNDKTNPRPAEYVVEAGTPILLSMINSNVSSKDAAEGDRVYLKTAFPIRANGRIVIPAGSYVAGTVTEVKRPGRIKGRANLYLRFDSLTLENGVTRDFRARVGSLAGHSTAELERDEGKIRSEGTKGEDARTVAEGAATGASVGGIAGSVGGRPGIGLIGGSAAGAAAGLAQVLLTRGPEAVLVTGTTVEMVLDRPLHFSESDLEDPAPPRRRQ